MILSKSNKLNTPVLVLNRFYMAIQIITARRAFVMLCRDAAEVIDQEDGQFMNYSFEQWLEMSEFQYEAGIIEDDVIQTVRFPVQIPRVVRTTNFDRVPDSTVKFSRKNLFVRDKQQCQYCGKKLSFSQMSLDHVVPRSQGGGTSWDNVVCSCFPCNSRKGGRTPKEARMELLQQPEKPRQFPLLDLYQPSIVHPIWEPFTGS